VETLIKWLGPGAVVGGLGAAMLCGAGLAGADTGQDAGSGDRSSQASASRSDTDSPARSARSGTRGASARVADAPEAQSSRAETLPDLAVEVPTPRARVSVEAEAVALPNDNEPVAAALASAAPAAAVVAKQSAAPAATVAASSPAPAAATTAAPAPVVPSSVPVDPAQFAGTYYEQGSVKQFFSFGLVNTKAVYTAKPNGTLGVQNSGNYFFKWGPKSSITGSAVPVNSTNTALNVGFGGTPSANPPGNYLILDRAPDYSWVIVSDPSGRSGYILTRSKTIDPATYQQLLAKSRALGVTGRITPTTQYR
jgi:lipocalin